MERLDSILFYSLEKAIKSYRQLAQRNMFKSGFDLTIDQWLVLKTISDNPNWTQHEVAEAAFKDLASVTRIIEILVKKKYVIRTIHSIDRRRFELTLTDKATKNLQAMQPITEDNRRNALQGINKDELLQLHQHLAKIIDNCKT
jgi:MarR family transcriptional regulator for hemolysin